MTMSYISRRAAVDGIADHMLRNVPQSYTHVHSLQALVREISNGVSALGSLHATPNPTDNSFAHVKRVGTAAKKLKEKSEAISEKAHLLVREGLNDINRRIGSRVDMKPDEKYGQEIRSLYRSLKPGEQIAMLSQLARENRGGELCALIDAPSSVTGITKEVAERHRQQIISIHAASEHAEQTVLLEALPAVFSALRVANEMAAEYENPQTLAKIAKGEEAAKAADAAFSDAVQS